MTKLVGLMALAITGMLVAPVSANLLGDGDGGFEDTTSSNWTGSIIYDNPHAWPPAGPHSGSHWGAVQSGGQNINIAATLTSVTVAPSTMVTLTGYAAGGTTDGTPADLYVQLIDGSSTGDVVVGEWRVTLPVTYGFGWTPFAMSGHIASGHVKIKFGIQTSPAWSEGTALNVDTLVLTPEPASLALFGLAGLPLVVGRRRQARV